MNIFGNISVDALSDQELADIKGIAKEMLDSGQFGSDQFKIALLSFLVWCGESGTEIQICDPEESANRIIH